MLAGSTDAAPGTRGTGDPWRVNGCQDRSAATHPHRPPILGGKAVVKTIGTPNSRRSSVPWRRTGMSGSRRSALVLVRRRVLRGGAPGCQGPARPPPSSLARRRVLRGGTSGCQGSAPSAALVVGAMPRSTQRRKRRKRRRSLQAAAGCLVAPPLLRLNARSFNSLQRPDEAHAPNT